MAQLESILVQTTPSGGYRIGLSGFELCRSGIVRSSGCSSLYATDCRYAAPEVLLCCGVSGCLNDGYGTTSDVWSLGVLAYTLLCGYEPFLHTNKSGLIDLITNSTITFDPNDWRTVTAGYVVFDVSGCVID